MGKEEEYREIFLSEAQESQEQLNKLFTELEKDITNKRAIDAIFRITHTLKGNAMGMGFTEIAELGHVMEDVFNEVKNGNVTLDQSLFDSLYKANDILSELIESIKVPKTVRYKGIKTKLEVMLKNSRQENQTKAVTLPEAEVSPVPQTEVEALISTLENVIEVEDESLYEDTSAKIVISDTVQVPVRKLDALLNIVGELIIEKDTIMAKYIELGSKASDFARLHRITSDLQFGVMDVRLVQVGFLFNKFHRILRDVAVIENKKVDLVLEGTEIEIDRNIIRTMSDSLVHMIRNSVSHGIEKPEQRIAAGKSENGKVCLRARNEK